MKKKKNKKIKILCYGDTAACSTGFGRVIDGIFTNLARTGKYDITIFGINDRGGWKDPKRYPYKIYPAMIGGMNDFYGRGRFVNVMRGGDPDMKPPWDIIFLLQDPFILEEPLSVFNKGLMQMLNHFYDKYRESTKPRMWFKTCFTGDTETMTEVGIKKIKNVKVGERLYSINPKTQSISLQEVEETFEFDFDGKLTVIENNMIDFEVTPEHRFLLSTQKNRDRYSWITAQEIVKQNYKSQRYFPPVKQKISGKKPLFFELLPYLPENQEIWIYGDINKFRHKFGNIKKERIVSKGKAYGKHLDYHEEKHWILPLSQHKKQLNEIEKDFKIKLKARRKSNGGLPLRLNMADFLTLMGWYISEGHFSRGRLDIAQSVKNPKNRKEIKDLFTRLGINFTVSGGNIRCSEPILGRILAEECGDGSCNKKIPQWAFSLDSSLLKYLFDSLMKGDGTKDKKSYSTISKKLADQMIQLALHLGFKARFSPIKYKNSNVYIVSIKKSYLRNGFSNKNLELRRFKGKVYCMRVKNNHTIFAGRNKKFQFIGQCYYIPIDSPIKGNWVGDAIGHANYQIAYTNYGKKEIEKANQSLDKPCELNLKVIYHGTDLDDFHVVSDKEKIAFKNKYCRGKIRSDTFFISVFARNQMRKDIPRAMRIFREFQKRRPDSFLYIHAKERDSWGSLMEYARNFDLELGKDWTFPKDFNENTGFPIEALNLLYNITDVQLSTTTGEGWSLTLTEAMATKTINLAPNITSIPELFGTEGKDFEVEDIEKSKVLRGIPVKSYSTSSEWATYGPTDYERIRPLTNVDDAVRKLLWVYDNPKEVAKITDRAYEWVKKYTWKSIAEKWDKLFQEIYEDLETERKIPRSAGQTATAKQNQDERSQPKRDESRSIQ